ncbi:pre-rRNA-processing protein TSR1 homolog [Polypterus senegalus]|uniref:pre-rRNA-processing protein TSR1 homolog n=1 Tax=Polypterus senegalus TaxID=55291 RepID=UPI001965F525|nr:pre-rRNA-processing protein TSR1 homolog [Polypterus senegalus]
MAAGELTQAHRPGVFKQKNKQHKHGKHRTKGETERENKGRVPVKTISKKQRKEQKRLDRRHKARQLRCNKKDAVLTEKRHLGGKDGPPHLVAVIALHATVKVQSVMRLLQSDETGILHENIGDLPGFGFTLPRFKQRLIFTSPNTADLHAILDIAKVADTLLFVLDSTEGWDSYGDYTLSCLFAQGLPSHALVTVGFSDVPVKKRTEARRLLNRLVEVRFPDSRLFSLDSAQDSILLLRHLVSQKQRKLFFRSRRPYLLAQHATFQPGPGALGTLQVSGYVRGQPLSVNRLLHIVGHGDFQMSQIDASRDPLILKHVENRITKGGDVEMQDNDTLDTMDEHVRVLMKADPTRQESLQSEAEVDPMEGEQTWPTESELKEAEDALHEKKKLFKKVPKGTSEYQASWILEEDEEGEEESGEDESSEADEQMQYEDILEEVDSQEGNLSEEEEEEEEEEEDEAEEVSAATDNCRVKLYDEKIDEQEEQEMLERYKQARADEMFPDEVDTPMDTPARIRFQRYRGLKSFRTSPWDPKENLPPEYSRIYQFQNFERTRKRAFAFAEEEPEGAMVGWYVTIHVKDVPSTVIESFHEGQPLVLVSLLPHEQKMSVLHMLVRRHPGNSEPIKSKEELIFHCGFRRFRASPVYSQHTSGDKHKMERFLRCDMPVVASVYAPVTFPTAGVLVFKQRANGMQDLVATGSLLNSDPDRVIVKRIVLSGHPFKIMRRTAVVRYMFFNREDVLWFKPVELRTKWGRRGHIKEALGTHGHMKCIFDNQLRSQDTILMHLYKRIYPKWTYDPHVPEAIPWVKNESSVNAAEN